MSPPRVGFVITIATARQWPVDDGHGRPGRVPLRPSGMISASDSPIGLPLIGCRIQGGLHSRRHRVAPVGGISRSMPKTPCTCCRHSRCRFSRLRRQGERVRPKPPELGVQLFVDVPGRSSVRRYARHNGGTVHEF